MAESSELASYLYESGLEDTAFWIPLLAEQQVSSKQAFKQLEGNKELFHLLETRARSSAEKATLHKALKMNETEKTKEVMEQERAWEIITELHTLQSQGKKRQDERVGKLEDDLRSILEIPLESWISKDFSLNEFLRMLKTRYEISGQKVLPRTPPSQ